MKNQVSHLDCREIHAPDEIMDQIESIECAAVRASIWAGAYQVLFRKSMAQAAKIKELQARLANKSEAVRADCCN